MRKTFLTFLALIIFTYSCNYSKRKDFSFLPDKYKELGMPDYKKVWTEDDYMQATTTLYDIKAKYPNSLPRFESEKSGVYFAKITDINNLYFLNNDTIPLSDKAYHIQMYLGAHVDLVNIYTSLFTKRQYYHREIIEVNNFSLKILHEMLTLADIIMKAEDPDTRGLQQGLQAVQFQYLTKIGQLLTMQNDHAAYNDKDLEKISRMIYRSLQKNSGWMSDSTKNELSKQITDIKTTTTGTTRANLKKSLDALQ